MISLSPQPQADDERMQWLVSQLLDGSLDAEQHAEIALLVRGKPLLREVYFDCMALHSHLRYELQGPDGRRKEFAAGSPFAKNAAEPANAEAWAASLLNSPEVQPLPRRAGAVERQTASWSRVRSVSLAFAAIAVLVMLAVMSIVRLQQRHRGPSGSDAIGVADGSAARIVELADCRFEAGGKRWWKNQPIGPGEAVHLAAGYAEIEFGDGSSVILAGPARMEIASNSGARLALGKVAAKVPAAASGFSIQTPTAKIIDLGTEFGVRVGDDSHTDVHVFSGKVRIERRDAPVDESTIELTENQAVRLGPNGTAVREPSRPHEFVQRIPPRESFPVHGTGQNLMAGEADPYWQIAAMSTDDDFIAQDARVIHDFGEYQSGDPAVKWISLEADHRLSPVDCRYTFRTTFDLTGFDAATARLNGRYGVDNQISSVRLNGAEVALPKFRGGLGFQSLTPFTIQSGFRPGENVLEIVVDNVAELDGKPNPMALLVELRGTARRISEIVERQGDD